MDLLLEKLLPGLIGALMVVAVLYWTYHCGYDSGYAARETIALKAEKAQRKVDEAASEKYQKALEAARTTITGLTNEAAAQTKRAADFYAKLQEARQHVPLQTIQAPGQPVGISLGFVGLFNLAVKGESVNVLDDDTLLSAAGPDGRFAGLHLSDPAKVTLDNVLAADGYNYEIAHRCLRDRATMKKALETYRGNGLLH